YRSKNATAVARCRTPLSFMSGQSRAEIASYHWFFFSSRRRHTRSKRDWSSDVCSSDLKAASVRAEYVLMAKGRLRRRESVNPERSEERRVGKECRSRCTRYQKKTEEEKHRAKA